MRRPAAPIRRSGLTVALGGLAIVLGLASMAVRLIQGQGFAVSALLPVILGVVAILVSGRIGRR